MTDIPASLSQDPVALCAFLGLDDMYPWQLDILRDLHQPWSRVAAVTPNGAGKTNRVVVAAGLSMMMRYPGSKVVSTAGTFRQVSDQLWPAVRLQASRLGWKITDEELTARRVNGLPASTWTIFATNDPQKAEGYHNREITVNGDRVFMPLLYIIDEAKGVADQIFEARDRCQAYAALEVSTPGADTGAFYRKFASHKSAAADGKVTPWKVHEITKDDCPHLNEGGMAAVIADMIAQYGDDHPFIQSSVYGRFVRAGGYFIFTTRCIATSMGGSVPLIGVHQRAAVDCAGGGDEMVFAVRKGNTCQEIYGFIEKDTAKATRILLQKFRQYQLQPDEIVMDEGGLGKPIIDELEMKGYRGIRRYRFNAPARDSVNYANRPMEDAHRLSLQMQKGVIALPLDEKLKEQMRCRRYEVSNVGGLLALEDKRDAKKRGEKSPDRLDCMVMLYSDAPDYSQYVPSPKESRFAAYFAELEQEKATRAGALGGMRIDSLS